MIDKNGMVRVVVGAELADNTKTPWQLCYRYGHQSIDVTGRVLALAEEFESIQAEYGGTYHNIEIEAYSDPYQDCHCETRHRVMGTRFAYPKERAFYAAQAEQQRAIIARELAEYQRLQAKFSGNA
jgi:hypothetical protein